MLLLQEAANHAPTLSQTLGQGVPVWLQTIFGSALFLGVSAAGFIGYAKEKWEKTVGGKKESGITTATIGLIEVHLETIVGLHTSEFHALQMLNSNILAASDQQTAATRDLGRAILALAKATEKR